MSTLNLNVISWNVGGSGDTQRLMKLAGEAGEINRFTDTPMVQSTNQGCIPIR